MAIITNQDGFIGSWSGWVASHCVFNVPHRIQHLLFTCSNAYPVHSQKLEKPNAGDIDRATIFTLFLFMKYTRLGDAVLVQANAE